MATWQRHTWPGNVRELKNVADRLCLGLEGDASVQTDPAAEVDSLGLQVDGFERHLIIQALRQHVGSVTLAAEQLKLPRKTLYDKVARYGIDPARYRTPP